MAKPLQNIFATSFILLTIASLVELVRFTQEPHAYLAVKFGQSVSLHWNYVLQGTEELIQNEVFFQNSTMNKFVIIAKGTSLTKEPGFSKVKTFPDTNFSVVIINVDHSFTGIFYFQVTVANPLKHWQSRNVVLMVEGKPVICDKQRDSHITVEEGSSKTIDVSFWAHVLSHLFYKWDDREEIHKSNSVVNGSLPHQVAKIYITNVQRDRCGKYITYFAGNDFYNSTERRIKVNVLFNPTIPMKVMAQYTPGCPLGSVSVTWEEQQRGSCSIWYKVDVFNSLQRSVANESGKNINSFMLHDIEPSQIRSVKLTISTSKENSVSSFFKLLQLESNKPPVWITDYPPPKISVLKGSDVWFSWRYDHRMVTLISQECKFVDETRREVHEITTGNPLLAINPNIRTHNNTFGIINVDLKEKGTYFCGFLYEINDRVGLYVSSETHLMVEAKSGRASHASKKMIQDIVIGIAMLSTIFI